MEEHYLFQCTHTHVVAKFIMPIGKAIHFGYVRIISFSQRTKNERNADDHHTCSRCCRNV